MKNKLTMLAAAGLVTAFVSIAQAQTYYLAGNFQGWCNNCSVMTDNGLVGTNGVQGSHQWEYDITGQTPGSLDTGGMKVTDGTWDNNWPGANMNMYYNGSGAATIYFYFGNFSDGWIPSANRVGFADPGTPWEVTGTFTTPSFGSDPSAQMTLVGGSGGVYTNTYVIATPGSYQYKFRTTGTWGALQAGTDISSNPGNLAFTTTTPNQAVTFTLDLPNGRWAASVPPVYCNVQFAVDMTVVAATDAGFDRASVTVNGGALAPNGWGGTICTNDPNAINTNLFTSPFFSLQVGTSGEYQFRYVSGGNTVYDALGGVSGQNRSVTVPNLASTNIPPVYFNDALPTDLLNQDTTVYFTVNMTNAVGTDAHVFDPVGGDLVFMNGDFTGWLSWNPPALSAWQLIETPAGSWKYQMSYTFPKGHSRSLTYKYAINGLDNEAGFAQNHFRFIRSTNGVYYLPVDTFGTQYNEPKVGGLTINHASGTTYPVIWQPYPDVHLQSRTNLAEGNWQDVAGTTGTTGSNPTVTNLWSSGENAVYFRLKQP
jgi:hypothetical protein